MFLSRKEHITHSFVKLRNFHCDQLRLLAILELIHLGFILDELTKNIGQEFLVVPGLGKVFTESLQEHMSNKLTYGNRLHLLSLVSSL